ncbi:hypothetical protein GA0074692_5602 [Micromonospora pallida]|uniref:Uncharacterized protein n=1 Tax=Micromonospora pallida TaxID=145854 RepID=A0A1C6TE56_9ACTN|nr:hypothetical protein [Micromonospora pallida]SCL40110.1 hypothetical protein GA0074692_5602 [Micromonospora pallida]
MDSHAEGRSGTGWLAGLTVLVLLAGAGWWTTAEPETTPGAATAPRADAVMRATAASRAVVAQPESPRTDDGMPMVDPTTGQIVQPSGSRVTVDPLSGRVLGVIPAGPAAGASRVGTVVWRETRLLTDNVRELRRESAGEPGTRYQLLISCAGDGGLLVRAGSGRLRNSRQVSVCDGTLHLIGVTATSAGPISVRITHPQVGAVELTAMLVALD